ncbi:MAG TPA: hypothetical protein VNN09_13290, partial [Candidatus Competibacteraceae bacterium]|nr:hypothetical protein [Candidatus Competibacteraceae bacterium]
MSLTPYLSPLPAGAQVHVYRIEALLEHGRFDLRYQAWDEDLQDRVELREYAPGDWCRRGDDGLSLVPRPEVATEVAVAGTAHGRERFLDEARRLARVRHPALPRQLRCFQANGSVYSVSDLPRGEPLSALLERGAVLEEALLRALLKDVLAVLEQLHAQGCVHQAILPEHLWWDGAEGRWQLVGCGAFRAAMSRYVGQVSE